MTKEEWTEEVYQLLCKSGLLASRSYAEAIAEDGSYEEGLSPFEALSEEMSRGL